MTEPFFSLPQMRIRAAMGFTFGMATQHLVPIRWRYKIPLSNTHANKTIAALAPALFAAIHYCFSRLKHPLTANPLLSSTIQVLSVYAPFSIGVHQVLGGRLIKNRLVDIFLASLSIGNIIASVAYTIHTWRRTLSPHDFSANLHNINTTLLNPIEQEGLPISQTLTYQAQNSTTFSLSIFTVPETGLYPRPISCGTPSEHNWVAIINDSDYQRLQDLSATASLAQRIAIDLTSLGIEGIRPDLIHILPHSTPHTPKNTLEITRGAISSFPTDDPLTPENAPLRAPASDGNRQRRYLKWNGYYIPVIIEVNPKGNRGWIITLPNYLKGKISIGTIQREITGDMPFDEYSKRVEIRLALFNGSRVIATEEDHRETE